jgi:uncharacterized damage-inducible protein DinB
MDHMRLYEYVATSRAKVLDAVRPMSEELYNRSFPFGINTLARTITHIMVTEWYYVERMLSREVPPQSAWAIHDERPPTFVVLDAAWREQMTKTRASLASITDWNATLRYEVERDDGTRLRVTTTTSDIFTQFMFHEVHHRAQAMAMLRQVGVVVQDLDYSGFAYGREVVASGGAG